MDTFQIISAIMSIAAVLLSLISLKQKKTDKETDVVRDIAVIKQDLYSSKLGDRIGKLERDLCVIEERLDNEIKALDKLDTKLDEIKDKINE